MAKTKKTAAPPPAYFLSLSLENVRSFGEKQTIHFTEGGKEGGRPAQWTIILGDNGVGKTTVLKSLAALQPYGPSTNLTPYLTHPSMVWQPYRHSGEEGGVMDYNINLGGYLVQEDIEGRQSRVITQTIFIQGKGSRGVSSSIGWNRIVPELEFLVCNGYGAGRSIGSSSLSEERMNTETSASLFSERADLLNPEEWFLQLDYSSYKEKDGSRSLEMLSRVYHALLQVLPDVEEIRINTVDYQQYLELKTPYGWVRLRDMSLGYQTLVVWLTDFASKLFIRYPESKNPLEEPAIVLIDEIDLHLHPSWQRKLIGFLSGIFKNTQFIATAHSPLVVQAAGDAGANVVLLRREGDQTKVVQNLPDVRRWRVDQILSSELFEDASPLSPQTEQDLARRNQLLLKKRLTAKDKAELAQLDALITAQPVGNTPAERHAEDLLARLARHLGPDDLLK